MSVAVVGPTAGRRPFCHRSGKHVTGCLCLSVAAVGRTGVAVLEGVHQCRCDAPPADIHPAPERSFPSGVSTCVRHHDRKQWPLP